MKGMVTVGFMLIENSKFLSWKLRLGLLELGRRVQKYYGETL